MGFALIGAAAVLGLLATGYIIGIAVSSPGRAGDTAPTKTPKTCDDFCNAFQMARMDFCSAQGDWRSAQSFADSLQQLYLGALAAAAAALAAAIALSFVPFVGPALAAVLFSASATLSASAITLLGVWGGAVYAALQKQIAMEDARKAMNAAAQDVIDHCPAAKANACLATPSPC